MRKATMLTIKACLVSSVTSAIERWFLITGAVGALSANPLDPCHDIPKYVVTRSCTFSKYGVQVVPFM